MALGREAGLLSPHAPKEYGGLGLDHRGIAVVFEAATWSPLGHLALNIQAPDEGNVNLLMRVASPEHKARLLPPLVAGELRTVFSMTETVTDGAGSDPVAQPVQQRRIGAGERFEQPPRGEDRQRDGRFEFGRQPRAVLTNLGGAGQEHEGVAREVVRVELMQCREHARLEGAIVGAREALVDRMQASVALVDVGVAPARDRGADSAPAAGPDSRPPSALAED